MMRPRTLAVACLVALGSPAAADEFCASDELTELVNDPSPCRGHTELILSPAAMPSPLTGPRGLEYAKANAARTVSLQ
jgi:hypothetical protein